MRRLVLILLLLATPLQWSWAGVLPVHTEPCPCGPTMPADPPVAPVEAGIRAAGAVDEASQATDSHEADGGCCDADCLVCQGHVPAGLIVSPMPLPPGSTERARSGDTSCCPDPLPDELLRPPRA